MGLIAELRRRHVFRMATAYVISSWLVLQAGDLLFDLLGLPDWSLRLLLGILVLGFPVAMVFSWVFEITPGGIKKETEMDAISSRQRKTSLFALLILFAVILASVLIFSRYPVDSDASSAGLSTAPSGSPQTLAILPFANLSDDNANEHFADGIAEELLNLLVDVDGLRVISRTSSFSFKGKDVPLSAIAEQLNVEHIIEGSVRQSGQRLRVSAQLIEVSTDSYLWSESYDRELSDVFAIQDDIAREIKAALQLTLGSQEPLLNRPTDNMQAHELYLKGLYGFRNRDTFRMTASVQLLEQATALDPQYARAWEALAMAYLVLPGYQTVEERAVLNAAAAMGRAEANATRALDLQPDLVNARAVKAMIKLQADPVAGFRQFESLLDDHPNSTNTRLWYAMQLGIFGYPRKARAELEIVAQGDPASGITQHFLAKAANMLEESERARAHGRRAVALGRSSGYMQIGIAHLADGNTQLFKSATNKIQLSDAERAAIDYVASPESSRISKPQFVADLLATPASNKPALTATPFYWLGAAEPFFDRVQSNADTNLGLLLEVFWYPPAQIFRSHPRMQEIISANRFDEVWNELGPPEFCRRVNDAYQCF